MRYYVVYTVEGFGEKYAGPYEQDQLDGEKRDICVRSAHEGVSFLRVEQEDLKGGGEAA